MGEGLNRVMLLGNLGAEPELRYTQGGQAVLNLRLATTESYIDRDKQRKERTDWHSVVVWGKRAEALAKFLVKGSGLFVEGSLRTSSYEGKDGQKRYRTEINARNVLLTGGPARGGAGAPRAGAEGGERGAPVGRGAPQGEPDLPPPPDYGPDGGFPDDDIPF